MTFLTWCLTVSILQPAGQIRSMKPKPVSPGQYAQAVFDTWRVQHPKVTTFLLRAFHDGETQPGKALVLPHCDLALLHSGITVAATSPCSLVPNSDVNSGMKGTDSGHIYSGMNSGASSSGINLGAGSKVQVKVPKVGKGSTKGASTKEQAKILHEIAVANAKENCTAVGRRLSKMCRDAEDFLEKYDDEEHEANMEQFTEFLGNIPSTYKELPSTPSGVSRLRGPRRWGAQMGKKNTIRRSIPEQSPFAEGFRPRRYL